MRLSVLTFNAGLLRFFGSLLEPAPHVRLRFEALAGALRATGAGVIAIQEIYRRDHRQRLHGMLADLYPFTSAREGRSLLLGDGLLILSRWPMQARLRQFANGTLEERWLGGRGVLAASLELENLGIRIFNVHATAGGLFAHPESAAVDAVRRRQIGEILAQADEVPEAIPILLGDFNAGPEASESNYGAIVDAGWVDCYAELNPGRSEPTWDPANALNRRGPHRSSPPQRIDHVFLRKGEVASRRLVPAGARLVFQEPMVRAGDSGFVTLSDHYGLQVELDLAASP